MRVRIMNWEKYNARNDVKRNWWFKLSNRFYEDDAFVGLSSEHMLFFVFLCCKASQNNSDTFDIDFRLLDVFFKWSEKQVESMVCDLRERKRIVLVTSSVRVRNENVSSDKKRLHKIRLDKIREEKKGSDGVFAPSPPPHVWDSYALAYKTRYGVEPPRNAKSNGQIAHLVARLGKEEAGKVAEFYLTHNNSFYVKTMHSLGPLLRDAEKLRTEWMTGKKMLTPKAIEIERMQSSSDTWDEAARIVRERKVSG